jgi:hypothetical protein
MSSASPFNPKAAIGVVLFGAVLFVALLWMIGSGMTGGSTNDGGNHAGGKGLNGYAALADLLERRGYAVSRSRSEGRLDDPGLLVLTPPHGAEATDIEEIISKRRNIGPTMLVMPKWQAMAAPPALTQGKGRKGWVYLGGASPPTWAASIPSVGNLDMKLSERRGEGAIWHGLGSSGPLADPKAVQSIASGALVGLVRDGNGEMLVGFVDDHGTYPMLDDLADVTPGEADDDDLFPLIVVAEPDLLDNYGMADRDRARLAIDLINAATEGRRKPVIFDLTLNGLGRSANLLSLAFTPPFLAATLCLLIAAIAIGWRAFLRFGPPRTASRAIAFGKQALISNSAGLIRRTRRFHLIAGPYADHVRERLARALALPRGLDAAATEKLIDRAVAGRTKADNSFSVLAARLRAARRESDIVRAAQDLNSLERTLIQ